jgi:hypothetical protein
MRTHDRAQRVRIAPTQAGEDAFAELGHLTS